MLAVFADQGGLIVYQFGFAEWAGNDFAYFGVFQQRFFLVVHAAYNRQTKDRAGQLPAGAFTA